jgi:hypothetical protein
MSKRFRITLSDDWARWVEDEALHRGQSLSELIEDALSAFERERVNAFEDSLAEAHHGWERRRRLKARARTKLTDAEREVLRL